MEEIDPIVPGEAGATAESETEKRRRWRDRKRKQRSEQKEQRVASSSETKDDWWASNRALLPQSELVAMLMQDGLCLDQIHWMEHGDKVPADDPDFVSMEEGVDCLVDFVKKNPCPHLGAIRQDPDIPSDWSTGVWRKNAKYWHDPALLDRLYAEGPATERLVKYGLLSGVPDFRVERFLVGKAKWLWQKVADLLGYKIDHNNTVRYR
jgi:hypothetical protein